MKTTLSIPAPFSYQGCNHIHLMMCLLIFISACSVLKEKSFYQADSLSTRNSKNEEITELTSNLKAIRVYNSSDSAEKQFFTVIIPRGPFKYSETEGFNGEAERLFISERVKESKQVRDSARLVHMNAVSSAKKSIEGTVMKTRLKEKHLKAANLNLIYPGVCILILVLIMYRYRRFFN